MKNDNYSNDLEGAAMCCQDYDNEDPNEITMRDVADECYHYDEDEDDNAYDERDYGRIK